MLPRNHPDRIRIAFDDHRLVNNAGLILPATLALHLGLPQLVDRHLDLGRAPGRANTGDKMMTLVASALAGGDCIDDAAVLRTGGTACTLGSVVKPVLVTRSPKPRATLAYSKTPGGAAGPDLAMSPDMNANMSPEVDSALTREIEAAAVAMAWGAGEILSSYFAGDLSQKLSIEYKDKNQQDPVTSADKATQGYLEQEIARRFPGHGILGEEESLEGETEDPAADFLWVLDPLDGTTNFLNGLPVYASSIGVLYRGWPLVGALYLPWPNPKGGFVLHCRRGGGCFADGKPVSVFQAENPDVAKAGQPVANRLIGLPGYFAQGMKFSKQIKGSPGELRTTGSIAYELGMTACGVLQYAVFGAPKLWDMLAGVLAVQEAGGTVMIRLPGEKGRNPMGSLVPSWEERPPSLKQLRGRVWPLVAGNRQLAPLISGSMRRRLRPIAQLKRLWRKLGSHLNMSPRAKRGV